MQSLAAMLSLTTSVSSTTVGIVEVIVMGILVLVVSISLLTNESAFFVSCRSGARVGTSEAGESVRMR